MRDRFAVLMITAAVALLLSACETSSTAGTGETTAAPGSSKPTLPPRPREIDLTGVDTCTLLTPEQQKQIGTDTPPEFTKYLDRYGNRRCAYGKIEAWLLLDRPVRALAACRGEVGALAVLDGLGQFGALVRDHLGRQRSGRRVVGLHATPDGWYSQLRRTGHGGTFVTVTPASHDVITTQLRELITETRQPC